ncbi:hypothetical protein CDL15_Pgr026407 [Punica granatum]|uniref:Uncharacterized protein n=1 Tax=Punica granatum TaxID=22663 RepID=A0A218XMP2_PUNGR|nr:hypothetical protein CDL15_Pgr026407 [Punica granatum]
MKLIATGVCCTLYSKKGTRSCGLEVSKGRVLLTILAEKGNRLRLAIPKTRAFNHTMPDLGGVATTTSKSRAQKWHCNDRVALICSGRHQKFWKR